ncbi:nuclear transport factor 2 family protein [Shewanella maritima]|uniref:nuclear transport factor 2 family protein n=1 Tax=Shewanella maritima TaxID=2520507 RepID=UPI0037369E2A
MYQRLNKNNLEILAQVYDETIEFQDPLHQVLGLTALTEYFAELYSNVSSIAFDIHQVQLMQTVDGSQAQIANAYQEQIANGSQALPEQGLQSACLFWTMTYQHPKLNRGQAINVEGMSQLQFTDKIIKHRDYFDAGQMLYQHVPILGSMIRILNKRIGGQA